MTEPYLEHYGILRKSGRYPWGSGEDPYQRGSDFYSMVQELKANGLTDDAIAKTLGLGSAKELKLANTIAANQLRAARVAQAVTLRDKGLAVSAVAKRMGINESSVRSLLDPVIQARQASLENTVNALRDAVDNKEFVDIGTGIENHMGISRDKLASAVSILKSEGYNQYWLNQETGVGDNKTTVKVLAAPGDTKEQFPRLANDHSLVKLPGAYSEDGGRTIEKIRRPVSIDSNRVGIVYGDEGGTEMDGLIELRRGVPELDLGNSTYAQVRILVDGDRYIKGVAVHSDKLPTGVDILVHTPKSSDIPKRDILKTVEDDPDNPFGASIKRQKTYIDADGKKQITALNIINEEGDWFEWKKNFSSQMLSKQDETTAKTQLKMLEDNHRAALDDIKSLTNPTLKQELLRSFSDKVDSDAVELQAIGFPRTAQHVIIPVPGMKDNEVYAPKYNQGERVALVRHPHGGIFEIPELIVNNKNPKAQSLLGKNPIDAIGINARVAEQLSGADFDGDTVLVIPNNQGLLKTKKPIKDLQDFNHRDKYPYYEGMEVMGKSQTQTEMGIITNLVTDMTIMGASDDEIVKAVKHTMVVIDARKHKLNYKQSYVDHEIASLKKRYQTGGASTLISRASAEVDLPRTKPRPVKDGGPIDQKTGEKKVVPKGDEYTVKTTDPKTGVVTETVITPTSKYKRLAVTNDARTLMSSKTGTVIERVYADHSNRLKKLANEARLEMINTPNMIRSKSAAATYAPQVKTLKDKLNIAQMNAPLERQAQVIAFSKMKVRIEAKYGVPLAKAKRLHGEAVKKTRQQELRNARAEVGAGKQKIDITPLEWEAIQAGAVAHTPLLEIFRHADPKQIKDYATPRADSGLSGSLLSRAKTMLSSGYTQSEIAETLGVSVSSVSQLLKKN